MPPLSSSLLPFTRSFFARQFKPHKHENQRMSRVLFFFLLAGRNPILVIIQYKKQQYFCIKCVIFTTKAETKIKFNFIWSSDCIVFMPLTANHFSLSFQRGTWYGSPRQGADHFQVLDFQFLLQFPSLQQSCFLFISVLCAILNCILIWSLKCVSCII